MLYVERERDKLTLKDINIITEWLKITQNNNKRTIKIVSFVETTFLTIYPWPTEITYGQGS